MFNSEAEMQEWLSSEISNIGNLTDLIINVKTLEKFAPESLEQHRIKEAFIYCLESLDNNYIITENTNISLKNGDVLKPDFLLYSPESESIIVVELKNSSSSARQAGTELGGYSSEVKSYVPFIPDGDIIHVIISTEWSVLLKHYVYHEIFWLQRQVLCLKPVQHGKEMKLEIIGITDLSENSLPMKLSERHLGGYHISLYDDELYRGSSNFRRLDAYLEQMKTALTSMATKGSSLKSHGFAILWTDDFELPAPYAITVVSLAPFQSLERHLQNESFIPNDVFKDFIQIIHEHDPGGQGISLHTIADKGISFLENFCSPRREDFTTWDVLKHSVIKPRTKLVSFVAWGIFADLCFDKLLVEYRNNNLAVQATDPLIGLKVIEDLIDPHYKFIDISMLDAEEEE